MRIFPLFLFFSLFSLFCNLCTSQTTLKFDGFEDYGEKVKLLTELDNGNLLVTAIDENNQSENPIYRIK